MKRDYSTGVEENVNFFVGTEIEHTPAFGLKTLFVTGVHSGPEIQARAVAYKCDHIFFGANHSFNPTAANEWKEWEDMISLFLRSGYLCSLDIPLSHVEDFNDGPLNEFDNFIPQIRVPIPYIKLWNYNTMLKIDDKDFNATNPGIWTHSLHELKDRSKFTSWNQYGKDEIIK